jgi:hypothetical protein
MATGAGLPGGLGKIGVEKQLPAQLRLAAQAVASRLREIVRRQGRLYGHEDKKNGTASFHDGQVLGVIGWKPGMRSPRVSKPCSPRRIPLAILMQVFRIEKHFHLIKRRI